MYKFSLSVRGYNYGRRYGLPHYTDWYILPEAAMKKACFEAGEEVWRHGYGLKPSVELYRAAGLGVFAIADRTSTPPWKIRELCERFDKNLHNSLY